MAFGKQTGVCIHGCEARRAHQALLGVLSGLIAVLLRQAEVDDEDHVAAVPSADQEVVRLKSKVRCIQIVEQDTLMSRWM